jgi:hypothetical protein
MAMDRMKSARQERKVNYNNQDQTQDTAQEQALAQGEISEDLDEQISSEPEAILHDETESEPEANLQGRGRTIFKTRPRLPAPSVTEKTLEELFELMKGPYLDTNPEYQREVVWSKARMAALIDSVIQDYYIPPILLNMERVYHPDGTMDFKRICIDGKQRLSSIKTFMEGRIPCHDSDNKTWYYCENSHERGIATKQTRRIMPESMKKEFKRKKILCYEFLDLSRSQEEDLFGRVQQGIQLTTAEKLRATTGKWQDLAKDFEHDFNVVMRSKFSRVCCNCTSLGNQQLELHINIIT